VIQENTMRTLYDTKDAADKMAQGLNLNEMMCEETEYRWTYKVEKFAGRYIVAAYDEKMVFVNYL